jgi:hypothetical protein
MHVPQSAPLLRQASYMPSLLCPWTLLRCVRGQQPSWVKMYCCQQVRQAPHIAIHSSTRSTWGRLSNMYMCWYLRHPTERRQQTCLFLNLPGEQLLTTDLHA